jgi:hypothetical protein
MNVAHDIAHTLANRDARAVLTYLESVASGRVHRLDQCMRNMRNIPAKLFDSKSLALVLRFKQLWPVYLPISEATSSGQQAEPRASPGQMVSSALRHPTTEVLLNQYAAAGRVAAFG